VNFRNITSIEELIKKSDSQEEYMLEEDEEDDEEIETKVVTLSLDDFILSNYSIKGAFRDIQYGDISKTSGNLSVWYLPKIGKYLLVDGWHRIIPMMLKRQNDNIMCNVVGEGYSNYHSTPSGDNIFIYEPSWKYFGLERIVSNSKTTGRKHLDYYAEKFE